MNAAAGPARRRFLFPVCGSAGVCKNFAAPCLHLAQGNVKAPALAKAGVNAPR